VFLAGWLWGARNIEDEASREQAPRTLIRGGAALAPCPPGRDRAVGAAGRGVLTLSQIRDAVTKALADRKAKAYLFDSYARGDATARDEIYILVIVGEDAGGLGERDHRFDRGDTLRHWATTTRKSSCTWPTRPHSRNGRKLSAPSLRGRHRGIRLV